ncbi:hypothetical protein ACFYW8_37770 [Streptomyces sp. NPDC002742]|uniref:hypothetical protein n=1 Tax=Streptomyces sp. NPDC002742 TaxID=3364663 RepID=UPI00368EB12E
MLTDSRFSSLPAGKRSPVKVPGSELIGRIPQALQEIQEAKADRLRGDALEGGLIMLLLCASLQRTRTGHHRRRRRPVVLRRSSHPGGRRPRQGEHGPTGRGIPSGAAFTARSAGVGEATPGVIQ